MEYPVVGGTVNVRMIDVVRMAVQVAAIVLPGNGAPTTFNLGQGVVNGAVVSAGRHVLLVRVLAAVIEVRLCRFALGIFININSCP